MSGIKTTGRSESSLNVILSSAVLFNQYFLNLLGDKPWQRLRCFLDIGSKPCCLNEVYRSTGAFSNNSLLVSAGCIDCDRPLAIMVLVTTLPPDTTHYVPVFLARWAFRFYLRISESSSASPQEEVAVIWSRPSLSMMYRRWDLLSPETGPPSLFRQDADFHYCISSTEQDPFQTKDKIVWQTWKTIHCKNAGHG